MFIAIRPVVEEIQKQIKEIIYCLIYLPNSYTRNSFNFKQKMFFGVGQTTTLVQNILVRINYIIELSKD